MTTPRYFELAKIIEHTIKTSPSIGDQLYDEIAGQIERTIQCDPTISRKGATAQMDRLCQAAEGVLHALRAMIFLEGYKSVARQEIDLETFESILLRAADGHGVSEE